MELYDLAKEPGDVTNLILREEIKPALEFLVRAAAFAQVDEGRIRC